MCGIMSAKGRRGVERVFFNQSVRVRQPELLDLGMGLLEALPCPGGQVLVDFGTSAPLHLVPVIASCKVAFNDSSGTA